MMITQLADQFDTALVAVNVPSSIFRSDLLSDRRLPVLLLEIFVQMALDVLQSVCMCHLLLASWMREFFKLLTKWLIGGSLLGTTSTIY